MKKVIIEAAASLRAMACKRGHGQVTDEKASELETLAARLELAFEKAKFNIDAVAVEFQKLDLAQQESPLRDAICKLSREFNRVS